MPSNLQRCVPRSRQGLLTRLAVLWLTGCATTEEPPEPPPPVPAAPDCNPIVGQDCLSGFPTSFYTVADKTATTGLRVDLPAAVMPATAAGALSPTEWNRRDGFSPNAPVLVLLPRLIDPTVVADETRPHESTSLQTATVLLDAATGKILPHLAELDVSVPAVAGRQALILRHWTPPQEGRRIVVALTDRLRDTAGKPFDRTPTFQRLVDGKKTGFERIDRDLGAWQQDIQRLEKAGIPRARLLAAWHYDTASTAWTHGVALQARDLLLAQIGDKGLGYTIDKIEVDPKYADQFPNLPKPADDKRIVVAPMHGDLAMRVKAKVTVPLFLTGAASDATLNWTGVGAAIAANGTTQREFVLLIPPSALKLAGKARLMLYGHGLLRGACDEGCVKPGDAEIFAHLANSFGVVAFGMDWWGLSKQDFGTAANVASDFNLLPRLSDKLVQAAVQPIALARTVRHQMLNDPLLAMTVTSPGGGLGLKVPPADAKADLVYYGNSLGGIMGTTHAALNPDLARMVMNVPAGIWSLMLNRSSNFNAFFSLLAGSVPDPWTQQVLFGLSQTHWDLADPINFADHVVTTPLPQMPANRKALWPIAWGDSQVPNLGSGMLQRVAGVPLLGAPVHAWFASALDAAQPFSGPGAFVQWDAKRGTHPAGNKLPWPDNHSHLATRWMPEFQQMVWRFLYGDGAVEQRYCLVGGRDGDGKLPCDLQEAVPGEESAIPALPVLPPPMIP